MIDLWKWRQKPTLGYRCLTSFSNSIADHSDFDIPGEIMLTKEEITKELFVRYYLDITTGVIRVFDFV
jgi:hypothetical protein